jgi:ABC-type uncharacterized transport system substrate-binding protein
VVAQAHQSQVAVFTPGLSFKPVLDGLGGVQVAKLIAQILRGSQPAELPIQTPDTLFLAFNLTTAKAIELELPPSVLERADRLVE